MFAHIVLINYLSVCRYLKIHIIKLLSDFEIRIFKVFSHFDKKLLSGTVR